MAAQSKFFSANGLKLHYLDFGNPVNAAAHLYPWPERQRA